MEENKKEIIAHGDIISYFNGNGEKVIGKVQFYRIEEVNDLQWLEKVIKERETNPHRPKSQIEKEIIDPGAIEHPENKDHSRFSKPSSFKYYCKLVMGGEYLENVEREMITTLTRFNCYSPTFTYRDYTISFVESEKTPDYKKVAGNIQIYRTINGVLTFLNKDKYDVRYVADILIPKQ